MVQVSSLRMSLPEPSRRDCFRPASFKSMKKYLFINSASSTLAFLLNVAVVFVMSPIIVRQLGNTGYGIWDLLLSFCGYLGLLELGIGPAIIRFVAKSATLEEKQETQQIFVTSATTLSLMGLACLAVLSLISLNPHRIFNTSPQQNPYMPALCILAGANLFVQFAGTSSVACLMGLQQHYRINLLRMALGVLSAIATWAALTRWGGDGILWLSAILLAGNVFQYTIFSSWAIRNIGATGLSLKLFSKKKLKQMFLFGINSSLIMLSDRIQRQSVPFVIGHTMGVANIVFYSIPARITEYGLSLLSSVGLPITPLLSAVDAKDGLKATRQAWIETGRWLQILQMLIALGVGFLGTSFIGIWMGTQYAERGKWVVLCISGAMFVGGLAPNSARLLVALGRHGEVAMKLVVISLIAIFTAIMLAPRTGLPGIAAAISLANMANFIVCWRKSCNCLDISTGKYLKDTLVAMGPPTVIFAIIAFLLGATAEPNTYPRLILNAAAASAGYLAAAWFSAIGLKDRRAMGARLVRLIHQRRIRQSPQRIL